MPEVWSINTTVRNPERILDFLSVLRDFEGKKFDHETQSLYQKKLVQNKFYKPNNISNKLKMEYENSEPFNEEETNQIFSVINNPDLRGRTSVSKCNQSGLAIAKQSKKSVIITQLGKDLLDGKISLDEYFFKYFIKWQLPNPLERGYADFDINPFLCTLNIIYNVNEKEKKANKKAKGISKEEFTLFIVPLKKYTDVDDVSSDIIDYRRTVEETRQKREFYIKKLIEKVKEIYGLTEKVDIETKCNNLEDYTDSAIRYFRKTQFIIYRGEKRYVDIAPSRLEEAAKLIKSISQSSNHYENEDDYLTFLIDPDLPVIPWENKESLIKIINNLQNLIKIEQNKIDNNFPGKRINDFNVNVDIISTKICDLKKIEQKLRENFNILLDEYRMLNESDLTNLNSYISKLNKLSKSNWNKSNAPLCLEWYTSLSLMALNDALIIKPNFVKGDDGLPLFTAIGGKPDIECYYDSFNLIVEVTLMKSRDQVNNEVFPSLRHLKDFKGNYSDKKAYCILIAPVIHRDTNNMLWYYVDNGFEGESANIIPLTINQYNSILKIVLENNNKGYRINHEKFEEILDSCSKIPKIENSSQKWYDLINLEIEDWSKTF